jgi:exosortase/archaeosortase
MTTIENIAAMPTQGTTESGGEIKMRRTLRAREGAVPAEIVLAYLPHNTITPLATWQVNTSEFCSSYWGHYFKADEADEAVADFMKRGR